MCAALASLDAISIATPVTLSSSSKPSPDTQAHDEQTSDHSDELQQSDESTSDNKSRHDRNEDAESAVMVGRGALTEQLIQHLKHTLLQSEP